MDATQLSVFNSVLNRLISSGDCMISTLHDLTDFYVERAHRIKRTDPFSYPLAKL